MLYEARPNHWINTRYVREMVVESAEVNPELSVYCVKITMHRGEVIWVGDHETEEEANSALRLIAHEIRMRMK